MRKLIVLLVGVLMSFGTISLISSGAAHADDTATSGSEGNATTSVSVGPITRSLVNGAQQVSWQRSNIKYKMSKKAVKKAPFVHINMSYTSKKLYKKTHGARVVRVSGTFDNTGQFGHILAGFPTTEKDALMVLRNGSHKYEHGYTLKLPGHLTAEDHAHFQFWAHIKVHGEKIRVAVIKSCFNDLKGNVQVHLTRVVQVESEQDVLVSAPISLTATSTAEADIEASCPDGSTLKSHAWATASATKSDTFAFIVKNQASAIASAEAKLKDQAIKEAYTNAQTNATTKAWASVTCGSAPVQHYTTVSCKGFEEVMGGEQMTVQCDVSNDNGAPISLTANSNNGYSRVSGTNCYSQGGTPSCSGNGMYEFQVTGINNGSSIEYSSVTVTATSNGVSSTWTSDSFPVDPSDGGF